MQNTLNWHSRAASFEISYPGQQAQNGGVDVGAEWRLGAGNYHHDVPPCTTLMGSIRTSAAVTGKSSVASARRWNRYTRTAHELDAVQTCASCSKCHLWRPAACKPLTCEPSKAFYRMWLHAYNRPIRSRWFHYQHCCGYNNQDPE